MWNGSFSHRKSNIFKILYNNSSFVIVTEMVLWLSYVSIERNAGKIAVHAFRYMGTIYKA